MNEIVLWEGRPNNLGFAKLTFTRYQITDSRVIIKSGFLNRTTQEIKLYRIRDLKLTEKLVERMFHMGDITLDSTDVESPVFVIRNVKDCAKVFDILSKAVEQSRVRHRAMEVTEVQETQ